MLCSLSIVQHTCIGGAGVIDLLCEGAIQRSLALLFCGPRLCAVGDERSSGLTGGRPRSAPSEFEVAFDALAHNQPTSFLGFVSATPANSQLLPLGLLPPSSAVQGDTCSLTTKHTRTPTPRGRPRMIHLIHAHSPSTLRQTTISLEHCRAGCLCRRKAAFGSTILLTCSIAGARAERPCRVKLTSLLSPRRALSEPRAELRMRPSRLSATPDPKLLIQAQDSTEGKLRFQGGFSSTDP